jgi:hypothetical protein
MVRAAGFGGCGGWVRLPPVSQEEAEREFGKKISENAWRAICEAFKRHGLRLEKLDGTRDNQNPNDPRGWHKRKTDAEKGIETALDALKKINREFLSEAEDIVAFKRSGGLESYGSQSRLDTAWDALLFLSWIMREAEPLAFETVTEPASRKMLAREVFASLRNDGANLSNGWTLALGEPSRAALTGFERLAVLLEIHQGETPNATAKWLREALAQDK